MFCLDKKNCGLVTLFPKAGEEGKSGGSDNTSMEFPPPPPEAMDGHAATTEGGNINTEGQETDVVQVGENKGSEDVTQDVVTMVTAQVHAHPDISSAEGGN